MFNIKKNTKSNPKIYDTVELLTEIRKNNCREILLSQISLKVLDRQKLVYPDKLDKIEEAVKAYTGKIQDLYMGLEIIDDELVHANRKGE